MTDGIAVATQKAVFSALDASTDLDSLLARHEEFNRAAIYGYMPQSASSGDNGLFPMVTIGEDMPTQWATDTAVGSDTTVMIHIWSRARGWNETKEIADTIRSVLDRQTLSPPDHEFIGMDWQNDEYLRDPDGITLHCAMEFRMFIDESGYGE